MFHWHAHTRLKRAEAIWVARETLARHGAWLMELRHLSDKASVFQLEATGRQWSDLLIDLHGRGVAIEDLDAVIAALSVAVDEAPAAGTLQLLFLTGEGERRDVVPAVPG